MVKRVKMVEMVEFGTIGTPSVRAIFSHIEEKQGHGLGFNGSRLEKNEKEAREHP